MSFEITIQRQVEGFWPVVVEQDRPGSLLPLRTEGRLVLDPLEVTSQPSPREAGTLLGRALFQEAVRDAFIEARTSGELRVLLQVEDAALRALGWQRLCAPRSGGRWDHLALDVATPFALHLPSLADRRFPAIGRRDLRALVVVASPEGLGEYELEPFAAAAAAEAVRSALGEIPCELLARVPGAVGPPTLDALCARLAETRPTLLHVVAHGTFRRRDGETLLFLEGEEGLDRVEGTRLLERLGRLGAGLPHLMFLATCESADPRAEAALGGLGQRLVRELGLPAVVAMSEKVSLETATALAAAFYRRLREDGHPDRALATATAGLAERHDVTVPALYSRLGDRPLWSDDAARELTPGEISAGLAELERLVAEHAPVAVGELGEHTAVLRALGGADPAALTAERATERAAALAGVQRLCEEVCELSFHALALGQTPPAVETWCPFRGLAFFRAEDRALFFGREQLVARLDARLAEHPFLALLGSSGSGKSSLALAGLVPAVERRRPGLRWVRTTPGAEPLARLEAALSPTVPELLVVDQLEEIFTLGADEATRRAFFSRLLTLAPVTAVVVALRADFWGECAPYPELRAAMQQHQELVAPMDATELRRAIELQARQAGLRFEADLAQTLIEDVAGEPGAMPLLQHALLELWRRRRGRWLRAAEYRALGGVAQAIAETAETIYRELPETERLRLRELCLRLTRLDPNTAIGGFRDTRRRLRFSELVPVGIDGTEIRKLVERLAEARLLVVSAAPDGDDDEVELAHESLTRRWQRLRGWLEDDRELLRRREVLREATREWHEAPEPMQASLLVHRGARLEELAELAASGRLELNAEERGYLDACLAARDAEREREEAARRRELEAARVAVRERRLGLARQLAAQSLVRRDERLDLALLLALEAGRRQRAEGVAPSAEVEGALLAAVVHNPPLEVFLRGHQGSVNTVLWSPDGQTLATGSADGTVVIWNAATHREHARLGGEGEPGSVRGVRTLALSPDARTLAVGRRSGAIDLWDTATFALTGSLESEGGAAETIAWSPDGKTLAVARRLKGIELWDVDTKSCRRLGELGFAPIVVAWSPDGRLLAAGGEGPVVMIWDTASGELCQRFELAADDKTAALAWSPDGRWLAGGGMDLRPKLWDVAAGKPLAELPLVHANAVMSLAWSLDGTTLVSGGADGKIVLWRPPAGGEIATAGLQGWMQLEGHDGWVLALAWRPDGQALLSGGSDGAAIVWRPGAGQPLGWVLGRHEQGVWGVAWSPDGQTLATGSQDQTILLWDVTARTARARLTGHEANLWRLAWSLDGQALASAAFDGTAGVWETATGALRHRLTGHQGPVLSVAWSPDGAMLASGGKDRVVLVWNARDGQLLHRVEGQHDDSVLSLAWSPDGATLASGDGDAVIRLWDVASWQLRGKLEGHKGFGVWALLWSRDGRVLVSGSGDTTIRFWDVAAGKALGEPLTGHGNGIFGLAWSPDQSRLASVGSDQKILLWDVATRTAIGRLTSGAPYALTSDLAWSPDGKLLATGGSENQVVLWNADPEGWRERACRRANRNLTREEWQRFVGGDLEWEPTCA